MGGERFNVCGLEDKGKKGKGKSSNDSKPTSSTSQPTSSTSRHEETNTSDKSKVLDSKKSVVEKQPKESFKKLEESSEKLSKLALDSKNLASDRNSEKPSQHGNEQGNEDKPRDLVMADRKAKKLAAQQRKAEATAQKKANKKEDNKQQTVKETKESQEVGDAAVKGTETKTKKLEEPSNKPQPIEHINGSAKERSGILKVRFDFKPETQANTIQKNSVFIDANDVNVHPAFRSLYAKCENHKLIGIDAICTEFIHVVLEFILSYDAKKDSAIPQDLDEAIQPQLSYLTENGTRALPLALGNLIKQLKKFINQMDPSIHIHQAKEDLREWLLNFYKENIDTPDQEISQATVQKLSNLSQCNILTYSWDPVVEHILLDLINQKVNLHVYIVDSPLHQGKKLLNSLCARNISCSYGLMNSLGYFVSRSNTVLLGCSAILSNGHVVANRGTGIVALTAQAQNIPILIAAKTYKFVDKVRTFEKNSTYISTTMMPEQLETIPDDLITALVTEMRFIPPSSAPAVLKIKNLANE